MLAAVRTHVRVTSALVIREMTTRYGSKVGGYLWAIIDPVAFITLMSMVFSAIARTPPLGRSFPLFYATGYVAFWFYRSLTDQVSLSVRVNRALLNYPSVSPYDTILARATLQIVTQFVVAIVIFSVLALMVSPFPTVNFAPLLAASAVAIALGIGVGMINVVLFHFSNTYEQIFQIVNRPLFIVSGIFFLPESIPHPYQDFLLWNPLVHVVGWFRQGFYTTYRGEYIDRPWLIILAFSSVVIGLFLIRIYSAQLRENE